MLLTLLQIEDKIREFTDFIEAPEEFIPTFGMSVQDGLSHIEIQDGHYLLIVCEDEVELSIEIFDDPDELLFKVLHDISFSMACDSVFDITKYDSFKERFFQAQKNIITKINLFYMEKVKQQQDTLTKEDTKALSDTRKKILLKSKNSKKTLNSSKK